MLADTRRYLLVIVLLLAGLALTWGPRLRRDGAGPIQAPGTPAGDPSAPVAGHVYFVDIEGWYRVTPYEAAVAAAYDLFGGSTQAVARAIPARLGEWQQVGADQDVSADPAVVEYLHHPTVALQRVYRDPAGQSLILTVLGNTGDDSFLLFSHTPETCYPGVRRQVIDRRRESILLDGRPMYAQYLMTEQADTQERMLVLFWYAWDSPERDPAGGVLSMRVSLPLPPGQDETAVLACAADLIRHLFPATLPWERF